MNVNTPPVTPGSRVICRDAEWLVTRVEALKKISVSDFAVHCVGIDDLVRGHQSIFLTQLDTIIPADPKSTQLVADNSNGYKLSKLFIGAQLRQMPATGLEPDLANLGVFKPMDFQLSAVKHALKQLRPRLLLADAVGLGKTIQVGMILTELIRRGRADRILVLAKKSMLTQFQSELWNRFNIPIVRLDSVGIAKMRLKIPANKNPFEVYQRLIISIDTLKNVARYEHFLKHTHWDVVIIDEAHNVAGASVPERHQSYRLARLLSRRTDSMLLTTATPHNGKKETFGRLISLLDPSAIPDPAFKEYDSDDIKNFFLMRFKEDIRQDAGEEMLAPRKVIPTLSTSIRATPDEEIVFKELADLRGALLKDRHASDNKKRQNHLLLYGLYKLFLSSPEACLKTVEKRIENLSGETASVNTTSDKTSSSITESDETSLGVTASGETALGVTACDQEVINIDSYEYEQLETIANSLTGLTLQSSSRYALLKQQLKEIGWNGKNESPRILIFTEYRKTQEVLASAIAADFKLKYSEKFENQTKQAVSIIHGGTPDTHLMDTVEAFATGSAPIRMLIATDVASEGINLHHECHHIIHFDLPWSIITLIQRNGRIDRLGQDQSPILRYLMVDTEQGMLKGDRAIFERLIDKVEEINALRRSGESVLKLYDAKEEEAYIADQGILSGNVTVLDSPAPDDPDGFSESDFLEQMLRDASLSLESELESQDQADADITDTDIACSNRSHSFIKNRYRLFSDKEFLLQGYKYLSEAHPDSGFLPLQEKGNIMILTAPKDLRRRLGKQEEPNDTIFGATAIPLESWPENDQFKLTHDVNQAMLAIKAARNMSGYWSQELLCTEQHPALLWIKERILMEIQREQAPIIISNKLKDQELCFCFIGQVASKTGNPLVVDGHAISFLKGGEVWHYALSDILQKIDFEHMENQGVEPNLKAAVPLLLSAVDESISYLKELKKKSG
ncbi:Helicase domain protein [Desulfamplus magnetovallimortis]|uniref:Helicase domain protein n=2 Tax=Desulfamplus magnetovallimortis TaxID=1246637 RepID=A0A1W1HGZ2_9BACT|nr:Helicase domain protein [Desulfamplus magnetovallimortis]